MIVRLAISANPASAEKIGTVPVWTASRAGDMAEQWVPELEGQNAPFEPGNFNRTWTSRGARAGVRRITVHDGRRTCATLLVDLDVHPREAMQILRHAQISVTMEIYTQASSKATRAALKRLSESLGE